jgi:hypothetical protein
VIQPDRLLQRPKWTNSDRGSRCAWPGRTDSSSTSLASDAIFTQNVTDEWSHGFGEIVMALLLDAGLDLTTLKEHDSAPRNALGENLSATSSQRR